MKLQTDIQPRRDGKLTVTTAASVIVFEKDDAGILSADVGNAEDQQFLLRTGNFYPADESDFKAAEILLGSDEGDAGDEGDDFEGDDDAPLIESNTKPKAKPGPKPKAKP